MNPIIQEEVTGCGIASAAALRQMSYQEAKEVANNLGIYANDSTLWSDTAYVRKLLAELGISTADQEIPFSTWEKLPDKALLAIKWHEENGKPFWHWVVFIREQGEAYVLDSKKALKSNRRTDFGRMEPRWFIEVDDKAAQ